MYKGADVDPWQLGNASDHFKTQEMFNEAMREDSYAFKFVPDWFVTQQQVKIRHDDDHYCNDNELIKWYVGYEKHEAQKAKIEEKLMLVAWHPSS